MGIQTRALNTRGRLRKVTMAVKFVFALVCLTLVVSTKSNPMDADDKAEVDNWEYANLDSDRDESAPNQVVVSNFKSPVIVPLAGKNAKIVGIMSTFLNVHPFGASIDYIWSYLLKIDPTLALSEVESILQEYPEVFELKLAGVGAAIERKWMFVAFKTQ